MTTTSVKDPVCGMGVETTATTARSEHKGQTFYFCSPGCKTKFDKAPDQYASDSAGTSKSDKSGSCCG